MSSMETDDVDMEKVEVLVGIFQDNIGITTKSVIVPVDGMFIVDNPPITITYKGTNFYLKEKREFPSWILREPPDGVEIWIDVTNEEVNFALGLIDL